MEGFDHGEFADAVRLAPLREAPCGVQACLAGVVIVDLGVEKFEDALGGLGCQCKERMGNTWFGS